MSNINFKTGDTIFHWRYGAGVIKSMATSINLAAVVFGDVIANIDFQELSFKPYSLELGGLDRKRPNDDYSHLYGMVGMFGEEGSHRSIIGILDYTSEGVFVERASKGWFTTFRVLDTMELKIYNSIIHK